VAPLFPRGRPASKPIEDYAFIGNRLTGALVARDGSSDWLYLPRFDSQTCIPALLGSDEHGRCLVAPSSARKPKMDCRAEERVPHAGSPSGVRRA
jgi:GH15 family glucan-1,4-alpha-glucosidase